MYSASGSWTGVTTGAHFLIPPRILPLELLKRSETDAFFLPNQILKIFVKNFKDFHQKFPVEKYFRRGQKYFFEVENFPKENRLSLIFLWKISDNFDLEKHILTSTKMFFRPEIFDENPYIFLQISSEFDLASIMHRFPSDCTTLEANSRGGPVFL